MQVGQVIIVKRVLTQEDFNRFAALSGDDNPIHVDAAFAARTRFEKTVAHGMFLYGIICGALAQGFPGGAQLEQQLMFPTPAYAGEELTIRLEVVETQPEARRARLTTLITRPGGEVACEGETLVDWSETWMRLS